MSKGLNAAVIAMTGSSPLPERLDGSGIASGPVIAVTDTMQFNHIVHAVSTAE